MSASHLPSSKTVVSVAVVVAMGTFSLTSEAQADASPTDILALKLAWLVLPNGRVRDVRIVDEGRVPHSASSTSLSAWALTRPPAQVSSSSTPFTLHSHVKTQARPLFRLDADAVEAC